MKKLWKVYTAIILFFMYMPIIVLIFFSFNDGKTTVWRGFTLRWYTDLFKDQMIMNALWNTLLTEFGPDRRETKKHPEIAFANAFIGNYLRLELLSRAGLDRQLIDETKGYFSYMAERTGTLWEFVSDRNSCNHGFTSYVAVLYAKSLLGVEKIDACEKTVTVRETDVPLEFCEATLPVPGGEVTIGWRMAGGERKETFRAPPGWTLRRR